MDNSGTFYKNLILSLNPTQTRRGWLPYVVLIGTLLLTGLFSYYIAIASRTKDTLRFNNEVERTQNDIQNRLQTYIALLDGTSGLFAASNQIDKQEFQAYINQLDLRQRYPGIQGIGFALRVTPNEIGSLTAKMQQQGLKNFALQPKLPQRNEYFTIIYLEPLDRRNQAAIGFDMFSESTRRTAMELARDTGLPVASGQVILLQEIDKNKSPGFLIYQPIYRSGSELNTVVQRRNAIIGFVYSPFRTLDLFNEILSSQKQPTIDMEVYDGTQVYPENLLYRSKSNNPNHIYRVPKFTKTKTFAIAGRSWTIVFDSRPELEIDSADTYIPYMVLGGIILSLILFSMTRSQVRAFYAVQTSNQRLELLYAMSSSLLMHEQPQDFITTLFNQLAEHLQLEVYFNYLFDTIAQSLQLHAYSGIDEHIAKQIKYLNIGQGVCGIVAQRQQPLIAENIQESTDKNLDAIRTIKMNAYACFPLISSGQLIGTLGFGTRMRSYFTSDELALLQVASDLVATAIERSSLIAQLQQQTEELRQSNRIKDEFLATLSHELRTPLNAILGWIQLLRTRKLNETKTNSALETIERNSKSLSQLIEDILDVSKIISGKIRLHVTQINLESVVSDAIDTVQPAADAKQIQIKTQLDAVVVWGDLNRLQQILWNLLSNAIKFTPKEGKVEIHLKQTSDDLVQIKVIDNGQGIKPEFLPYVFDRFRQADGSITRSFGGLGLGLAIVRHLVELHGGTVSADSAGEEKGATFTVNLPILVNQQRTSSVEPTQQSQQIADDYFHDHQSLEGIKILVVDDEADARELITSILEAAGAMAMAVSNTTEAINKILELKPSILISDIGMPGEDGYSLIRKVRSLNPEQGGKIPALALTAFATTEDRNQAITAGYQEHIAKPVEPRELVDVMLILIERRGQ
jgi:signal transduction histidine kinase/CHASE1-domain containing sensor protein/ActR/RegA family two-component response regulator